MSTATVPSVYGFFRVIRTRPSGPPADRWFAFGVHEGTGTELWVPVNHRPR